MTSHPLQYQVRISPLPRVVDQQGHDVPNSRVRSIGFPNAYVDGPDGRIGYINGPGAAEIEVDGNVIRNVPLC